MKSTSRKRIMAVSSGGGHWAELIRLRAAFSAHEVVWVTNDAAYRADIGGDEFHVVRDGNRHSPAALAQTSAQLALLIARVRPDIVISTGAAPGYLAIRLGKLTGARTIWVDSIANAEELSMSGDKAGRHADLWLTQSPNVARPDGPTYAGAVL